MTGTPSAFGKKLVHIICPGAKPFDNCHCARMVYGFWEAQQSPPVKSALAGLIFNQTTYKDIFKKADQVFLANGGSAQPAVVAAVAAPAPPSTQPQDDSPQVAAVRGGRGRGSGPSRGRGGRGRGRGSNTNSSNAATNTSSSTNQNTSKPHQKGPKHADLPSNASWACAQHWRKGRGAPYCSDPLVCQWVSVVAPRT